MCQTLDYPFEKLSKASPLVFLYQIIQCEFCKEMYIYKQLAAKQPVDYSIFKCTIYLYILEKLFEKLFDID